MGHEAVGEVVALGEGVKGFRLGDLVISPFSLSCGMSPSSHLAPPPPPDRPPTHPLTPAGDQVNAFTATKATRPGASDKSSSAVRKCQALKQSMFE